MSIMAIPGITSAAVQLALVAHCQNLASRFAVLDMPCDMVKPQELLKHRAIIDSDYAAMYHPWLQVYDMAAKKAAYIPPSGAVCGIYARSDNTRGVHKAPANEVRQQRHGSELPLQQGRAGPLKSGRASTSSARCPARAFASGAAAPAPPTVCGNTSTSGGSSSSSRRRSRPRPTGRSSSPTTKCSGLRVQRTIASFLRDMYRSGALGGRHRGRGLLRQHRPRHHDPVGHPQRPPHLRHRRRAQPPG